MTARPVLVSLADVAAVPCPYCHAPAGTPCVTARTRTRTHPGHPVPGRRPHGHRWDAARTQATRSSRPEEIR
jgi:hypothetical protein